MKSKEKHRPSAGAGPRARVRYAVVGLGHIAQSQVLPSFRSASSSELAALVSGDPEKLKSMQAEFGVQKAYSYEEFDGCLEDPEIDAIYVALPNDLHHDCCIRAANAGKHIICEKPIATSVRDAEEMLAAARRNNVRFMTAYRLHFEPTTLSALEVARSGRIGEPRVFNFTFSYQLGDEENIRTQAMRGGAALFDLGVYCINAARMFFEDEPVEVSAMVIRGRDKRFREVEEGASAILRFPKDRVATFTVSFGAATSSRYELLGTKGRIIMEPGYEFEEPLRLRVIVNDREIRGRKPVKVDQFAGEIDAFSGALRGRTSELPSALEGIADLRVIEAIFYSDRVGRPVPLGGFPRLPRPGSGSRQKKARRPARKAALVHVRSPQG
jgi:predicted dehydrogenase